MLWRSRCMKGEHTQRTWRQVGRGRHTGAREGTHSSWTRTHTRRPANIRTQTHGRLQAGARALTHTWKRRHARARVDMCTDSARRTWSWGTPVAAGELHQVAAGLHQGPALKTHATTSFSQERNANSGTTPQIWKQNEQRARLRTPHNTVGLLSTSGCAAGPRSLRRQYRYIGVH